MIYLEPSGENIIDTPANIAAAGFTLVNSWKKLTGQLERHPGTLLVVLGAGVEFGAAIEFAAYQRVKSPAMGVVLLRRQVTPQMLADAMRAGIREVADLDDPAAIRAACTRALEVSRALRSAVQSTRETSSEGKVVTIFSGKGGCGKSTVATNLAVALAAGGSRRVCLIDLDLQFGDVAIMLQLTPVRSIADAIGMAGRLDEPGLRSLLTRYCPGVDVALAPAGPAEGEHVTRDLVTELINVAKSLFDFVVIDTPPFFSDQVLSALDVSDLYVPVVTPDLPTLKSVRLTLDMFDVLEYPRERRLALLNRANSQVGLTIADVEEAVGTPMAVHMPSSRDVPVSINKGVPIALDDPGNPVSQAIRQLANRCADVDETTTPVEMKRRVPIFGRRR
ncbi:CpaE family protein [Cryptosporangium sp. NPDC048952]|uniref:AAA family ATPase n=1 Tax=Cryptosporangium sp. NPDC048952 TaxID=3363961 RepID=UPI003716DA3F